MFRSISMIILLVLPLQSIASLPYTVNLAVYKNFKSLQNQLNKFPPALRKTVRITQRGKVHIATTLPTQDKKTLQKLLPSYKKVFSDAFISTYKQPKTTSIKIKEKLSIIKQEEAKVTTPSKTDNTIPK